MFDKLNLKKRDCDIKMRIVPYGGGWTDVHLDICGDSHYFIISYAFCDQFSALLALLYKLHPDNGGSEYDGVKVEYKTGICEHTDSGYKVVKIVGCDENVPVRCVCRDIPWKGSFTWDEEGEYSEWSIERIPDESTDFMLSIHVEHHEKTFEYSLPYKEFCYSVAKACTEMLKEYGLGGYYNSTYTQDMNLRHLLFIKSVALDNFEALELTHYEEQGHGETTDFEKELELLMFDM